MRRLRMVLVVVCIALVAGCGGDDDDSDASASAPGSTEETAATDDGEDDGGGELGSGELAIEGFEFVLQPVAAGSEVDFANRDGVPHTLTDSDGAFHTGSVAGGGSTTFTAPADAGSYDVICTIHPTITGTLEVE